MYSKLGRKKSATRLTGSGRAAFPVTNGSVSDRVAPAAVAVATAAALALVKTGEAPAEMVHRTGGKPLKVPFSHVLFCFPSYTVPELTANQIHSYQ